MAYIEAMIKEIEYTLDKNSMVYKQVFNDLSKEEEEKARKLLDELKNAITQVKKEFGLSEDQFSLAHIIDVKCNFIWETVEDLWSHKMGKSSGEIQSKMEKEKLDSLLKRIHDTTMELKSIATIVKENKAERKNKKA